MLRFRTGIIRFTGIKRLPTIEMHCTPGFLRGVYAGERLIHDDTSVIDKLVAIAASASGKFQFVPARPDQLMLNTQIPMDGMILTVVTIVDEILFNKENLPRREQIYSLAAPGEYEVEEDDPQLINFIRQSKDLLELGSAAEDMAKVLEISVAQVQFYLLKLRSAGVVSPLRSGDPFANDPSLQLKSTQLRLADDHHENATEVAASGGRYYQSATGSSSWTPRPVSADEPMPESGRLAGML